MFEIQTAQDVKNVIETLCPDEVLEITDKDGVVYYIQNCAKFKYGVVVSVGGFQVYCTDIQVWNDSVLKFRDDDVLVGSLRGIGEMTFAITPVEE